MQIVIFISTGNIEKDFTIFGKGCKFIYMFTGFFMIQILLGE
jgi:hypothetical protein